MTPHELVRDVESLYSLPDVVLRLDEMLRRERTTVAELAEVLACDPALTAKLLKLANSAYFGQSGKVETLARAIGLIGKQDIRDIALAATVTRLFDGLPPDLVDMETFWYNSIAVGILARQLGRQAGLLRPEGLFIAGLLHGVGRLVLYAACAEQYRRVLRGGGFDWRSVLAGEREVFGFTYADVGGELLSSWHLPPRICGMVAHHPEPEGVSTAYRAETILLHALCQLAEFVEPAVKAARHPDENDLDPALAILNRLAFGRPVTGETFRALALEVAAETLEMAEIIRPGAGSVF
jgi:HD-like signal output (HDOD) protein